MKTANAALVIAAGGLLLWVVISGRDKNLTAAWDALVGSTAAAASGSTPPLTALPNAPFPTIGSGLFGTSGGALAEPGFNFGSDLPSLTQFEQGTP